MNKEKVSVFTPFDVYNNKYIDNTKLLIRKNGIKLISIRKCLNPVKFFHCNSVNFNWFEKANTRIELFIKSCIILLFSIFRKRIIYTIHNRQPHNTNKTLYSYKLMRLLINKADVIVGLCDETKNIVESIRPECLNKVTIVPMPNYISNYTSSKHSNYSKSTFGIEFGEKLIFTYFGNISPYKNIELLIEAFVESDIDAYLLIVGEPYSKEYEDMLYKKILNCGNNNIVPFLSYIPDDEVRSIFGISDILVFPYDKRSSLNSSALILSYSMKRTAIIPRIGTVKSQKSDDFIYCYEYENYDKHKEMLKISMQTAYNDWLCDPTILAEKGKQAYEYVNRYHSDQLIMDVYKTIYGLSDNSE